MLILGALLLDSTSTTFQPFFLNFYKVHTLAMGFFLRMWGESGASAGDFPRVVALARSQYVLSCLRPQTRVLTFGHQQGQGGAAKGERQALA